MKNRGCVTSVSNVDAYIITQAQLQASDDDDENDKDRGRNRYRSQDGDHNKPDDQSKESADTGSGKDEWAF